MNTYNREQLIDMFGYCFQVLKTVSDLEAAIASEQKHAYNSSMQNYHKIRTLYNIAVAGFILICFLIGILQGAEITFLQFIIAGGISFVLFWLMFSPFLMVVNVISTHFAKKSYNKAAYNDNSNIYRQRGIELLQDDKFLAYKNMIPATYFNKNDLYLLYSYLETYRADTFKEAANLLAEEKHRERVEYNQQVMQRSLNSIEANARYQSVVQTIHLLETGKIRASL